jgi:hypothetical protein
MHRSRIAFAGFFLAWLVAGFAAAQSGSPTKPAPAPAPAQATPTKAAPEATTAATAEAMEAARAARADDTREALAILKEASDFLTAQKAYEFEAEYSYDAVQDTGQKLEFGGTRDVLVRRPDRTRVIRRSREDEASTVYYDGKTLSVFFPDDNAYVSVEKPGTLDEMVAYAENNIDTPMPFSDLIVEKFYEDVAPKIRQGVVVGVETVNKVDCVHLAFTSEGVDFQIWIDNDDEKEPLIRRLVIDYKSARHHPQFRAQIMDWDLDPDVDDDEFVFRPPKGAERLSVLAATELRKQQIEEADGGAR